MLEWFESHPDALTRQSLKAWAGSSAVTKVGETESKDYETLAARVIGGANPKSQLIRNRLNAYVTQEPTKKAEVDALIKQLDRIYTQYSGFRKKGVFPDTDTSNEIIDGISKISQGLKLSGDMVKFGGMTK